MKNLNPIGKYIKIVDSRNSDGSISDVMGISISKIYMPSVANTNGTDLTKYKVVSNSQFACNLMHVGRDGGVPIGMYKGEKTIVSPAYYVFEVKNCSEILPEYLHMCVSNPEFDREATYFAANGVRDNLEWNDFLNILIPVPSIDEQRHIVDQYQAIEQRIANNNKMIKSLETTAQNIYREMFVENIDEENLPKNWKKLKFYDVFVAKYGKGLATEFISEQGDYPVYGANGVIGYYETFTCEGYKALITCRGNGSGRVLRTYHKQCFVTNNSFVVYPLSEYSYIDWTYVYCLLLSHNIEKFCSGSAQPQLTNEGLNDFEVVQPPKEDILNFCKKTSVLFDYATNLYNEISELNKLKIVLANKL